MAPLVERQVSRDVKEPGLWPLVAAQFLELPPGPQEHLLRQVIGGLLIAGDAPEVAEDIALMLAIKGLEMVSRAGDSFGVGRGAIALAIAVIGERRASKRGEPA